MCSSDLFAVVVVPRACHREPPPKVSRPAAEPIEEAAKRYLMDRLGQDPTGLRRALVQAAGGRAPSEEALAQALAINRAMSPPKAAAIAARRAGEAGSDPVVMRFVILRADGSRAGGLVVARPSAQGRWVFNLPGAG